MICSKCKKVLSKKLECKQCKWFFVNPFDQEFCEKGKTATRICKQFSKK